MKTFGMNTNPSDDDEEAVFEAWRKRILAKEEARTIRRKTSNIDSGDSVLHFTPEQDLAAENGCWSPSGQRMKSRFLDL